MTSEEYVTTIAATVVDHEDGTTVVLPAAGYRVGDVIGRGGMGEVFVAHDRRIDRDVAIKRMRATQPSGGATKRFLREARIQARLDHPAIVPVYELGVDDAGSPFFTMKRLAGVTLADRLGEHVATQPLLRAFVDVCLAIEFAHARGVVHRDLKPSNIMLGDYGEVYVLDWGVARVLDRPDGTADPAGIDTLDDGTRSGDLLGTPGYMAPEQVRGEPVAPAADVYALGAILFEILAGVALHPRGAPAALASTLAGGGESPARARSARDIAPELDAACVGALSLDPAARPTPRALADQIQRYLDGDRDVAQRRKLAAEQLAVAHAALGGDDPDARADAMRAAGRALALDPESADAVRLVGSLIVEPPRVLPRELVDELASEERRIGSRRLRALALALVAAVALSMLLLPFLEIRDWTSFAVTLVAILCCVAALLVASAYRKPSPVFGLVVSLVLTIAFTRVVGPFVLTPIVVCGSLLALTTNPYLMQRPTIVFAWLAAAALGPLALERAGVLRDSWHMIDGGVASVSAVFSGLLDTDAAALVIANLLLLAAVGVFAMISARASYEARRSVRVQAWHLASLLPPGASRP